MRGVPGFLRVVVARRQDVVECCQFFSSLACRESCNKRPRRSQGASTRGSSPVSGKPSLYLGFLLFSVSTLSSLTRRRPLRCMCQMLCNHPQPSYLPMRLGRSTTDQAMSSVAGQVFCPLIPEDPVIGRVSLSVRLTAFFWGLGSGPYKCTPPRSHPYLSSCSKNFLFLHFLFLHRYGSVTICARRAV